jgi:hypothetical protein
VRLVAGGVSGLLPEPSGYAELLRLYWSIGRSILERQEQDG